MCFLFLKFPLPIFTLFDDEQNKIANKGEVLQLEGRNVLRSVIANCGVALNEKHCGLAQFWVTLDDGLAEE